MIEAMTSDTLFKFVLVRLLKVDIYSTICFDCISYLGLGRKS